MTETFSAAVTDNSVISKITFVQFDEPPLKAGEYTVTVNQTTNTEAPNSFNLTRQFAITGERFSFESSEIDSVFPPHLANGEFDGCLPHVVFNRRTLPWERYLDKSNENLPWLAILLFNTDEMTSYKIKPTTMQAADLITLDLPITAAGNSQAPTAKGKLPTGYISYPDINPLDYGELASDSCNVIDVDITLFSKIAPTLSDIAYLAHLRQTDSIDSIKNIDDVTSKTLVLGNRVPQANLPVFAFLVSLENMGAYLPDDNGAIAAPLKGFSTIRLITYRSWSFTANTLDQNFQKLLENLNATLIGKNKFSCLQFPYADIPPSASQVQVALAEQATGKISDEDMQILALNGFNQGYVPMNHEMRHADYSISWYRGPCVPYPVRADTLVLPISCPDQANRYDPQTGLFDISYGAAWQLGQLLALQNTSYANALYNWKKSVDSIQAIAAEQMFLTQKLQGLEVFDNILGKRTRFLTNFDDDPPALPDTVTHWLAKLRLLYDVPFQYLVPNEAMLPQESLRFFTLDDQWVDAFIDGAFSIGRSSTGELARDKTLFAYVNQQAKLHTKKIRTNRKTALYAKNSSGELMGILLRSQVLSGWPNLQINGYAIKDDETSEVNKLRIELISSNILLCIFDGAVVQIAIHEPPEQLHCGVELGDDGVLVTTLRDVTGTQAGRQFESDPKGGKPVAPIPTRADNQTLQIVRAAQNIKDKLNNDFNQGITQFTSAEFALEMIKGVVKVEFNQATAVSQ